MTIADEACDKAPLQFSVDKMAELLRPAEEDPGRQVCVPADIMHKLEMAFLGVLEIYKIHTAAGALIDGERFLCSTDLSKAIAPNVPPSWMSAGANRPKRTLMMQWRRWGLKKVRKEIANHMEVSINSPSMTPSCEQCLVNLVSEYS